MDTEPRRHTIIKQLSNQKLASSFFCHTIIKLSDPNVYLLAGATTNAEILFFSANFETNVESHSLFQWKQLSHQGIGIWHVNGKILSLDWLQTNNQSLVQLLSCGTDGRIIIWEFHTLSGILDMSVLYSLSYAVEYICTETIYATCVRWYHPKVVTSSNSVTDLFAASLTNGELLLSWKIDKTRRFRRVTIFELSSEVNDGTSQFMFSWNGNFLICAKYFASDVHIFYCNNWSCNSYNIHSSWSSKGYISAVAISPSGNSGTWIDKTGALVFIDELQHASLTTSLRWSGLPFVSLLYITDTILVAAGFDGIAAVFIKTGGAPSGWKLYVTLKHESAFSSTLTEASRYNQPGATIRSLSIFPSLYRTVSVADDYGTVIVWKLNIE